MKHIIALALTAVLFATTAGYASPAPTGEAPPPPGIRASIERVRFDGAAYLPRLARQSPKQLRVLQKVTAAIALGTVGVLAGGVVGAAVEPPCRCDDPGLKGAMIGMPVGAVLGAITGYRLVR
jgi:hypothetical protein